MAETIYVRGEGGTIFAMDLPLPEGIAERYERGLITRVNADGSPLANARPAAAPVAAPADTAADDENSNGTAAGRGNRPGANAPKPEWIRYVVSCGLLSEEDAGNYTKADLIDMVS